MTDITEFGSRRQLRKRLRKFQKEQGQPIYKAGSRTPLRGLKKIADKDGKVKSEKTLISKADQTFRRMRDTLSGARSHQATAAVKHSKNRAMRSRETADHNGAMVPRELLTRNGESVIERVPYDVAVKDDKWRKLSDVADREKRKHIGANIAAGTVIAGGGAAAGYGAAKYSGKKKSKSKRKSLQMQGDSIDFNSRLIRKGKKWIGDVSGKNAKTADDARKLAIADEMVITDKRKGQTHKAARDDRNKAWAAKTKALRDHEEALVSRDKARGQAKKGALIIGGSGLAVAGGTAIGASAGKKSQKKRTAERERERRNRKARQRRMQQRAQQANLSALQIEMLELESMIDTVLFD